MAKRQPRSTRRADALNPTSVLSSIRKGDLAHVYCLHGAEDFEKEELLRALISAAVKPAEQAFNLDVLQAEDLDIAEAINRATAFPMMAPRRMLVIKRIDRLPESSAGGLLPIVQAPPETTIMAFTADKMDGRKKLFSELRKNAVCVECRMPYENEVPDWLQRHARAAGKRMHPEAVHMLQLSVGSHPRDLANELEKLAIHAGDRETITGDDVRWIVGASRGATVFELAEAVGCRQEALAFSALKRLMEQGESPVGIVAILIRHIAILRKAKWLQTARLPRAELAGKLKVPPFFVSKYMDQAARFDETALWRAYDALLEADNRLKSRSRTPYVTLSQLVYTLCRTDV